jgi:hypothetical protein
MKQKTSPQMAGKSLVQFHAGNMMMLAVRQYPTLLASLLEIVQNAIDSNAKEIWVRLDRAKRTLTVSDNGDGATEQQFDQALLQVGKSMKDSTKLGRWGLGLLSPIDKCEETTFTSCPKAFIDQYLEWTFRADEIREQSVEIYIPNKPQNMRFGKEKKTLKIDSKTVSQVTWRTRVVLKNYSTDREIGRIGSIDDLEKEIFSRYSSVMREKKILLNLEFINATGTPEIKNGLVPPEYTGERLPEFVDRRDGLRTHFRLYLAKADGRKGKSNGTVIVGESHNPFRFPFKLLAANCGEYLPDEAVKALRSGMFEGEVVSAAVSLHESRKQFNINDGLAHFGKALEQWYLEIGAHYMEEVKDTRDGARYQELGLKSMQNIEAIFRTPRFSYMREMFQYLQQGTTGNKHLDVEEVVGLQDTPSKRTKTTSSTTTERKRTEPTGTPPVEKPKQTLKDHHPLTVTGPQGQQRNIVSGGSFGLQFSYEKMPGERRLWIFDETVGVLRFNIRHPLWSGCETSSKRLMQLQELVAVKAICWFAETATSLHGDAFKETLLATIDSLIEQEAFLLMHSSSFHLGPPKKVEDD